MPYFQSPPTQTDRVHVLEDRSLQIDGITIEDMGEYSCEADNAVGSITASGSLTVHCEYRCRFNRSE